MRLKTLASLVCLFCLAFCSRKQATVPITNLAMRRAVSLTGLNSEEQLKSLESNLGIVKTPCKSSPGRIRPNQGSGRCTGNLLTEILLPTVGISLYHNSTAMSRMLGVGKGFSHSLDEYIFILPNKPSFLLRGDGTKISLAKKNSNLWIPADPMLAAFEVAVTDEGVEERYYDGTILYYEATKSGDGYALNKMSNRFGLSMKIVRNELDLVSEVRLPYGKTIKFEINNEKITYIRGIGGEEYQIVYDASSRLTKVINPDDTQWNLEYHKNTPLIGKLTTPNGQKSEFAYLLGGALAGFLQNGHFSEITYSSQDVTLKDSFNEIKESFQREKIVKEESNKVITRFNRTDSQERITEIVDGLGRKTLFEYSGNNPLPSKVSDPFDNVVSYEYNSNFLPTKKTVQMGSLSSFVEYDWSYFGLPIRAGENGKVTEFLWEKTKLTVKGPSGVILSEVKYDSFGNITSETDRLGFTKSYQYEEGLLISLEDPFGRKTLFNYDGQNRLVGASGLGLTSSYSHDEMGNARGVSRINYEVGSQVERDIHFSRNTDGSLNSWSRKSSINGKVYFEEQKKLDSKIPGRLQTYKIKTLTGNWFDLLGD